MLARRHSRSIVVDGTRYRWAVSGDSGFATLVVQAESGGQRFEGQCSPYPGLAGKPHEAISPAVVERVIRYAVSAGWRPGTLGLSPFMLRELDTLMFGMAKL